MGAHFVDLAVQVKRLAIPLALLAACSGPAQDKSYTIVGQHGPLLFMLISPDAHKSEASWRGYVHQACGDAHICNVKIWTDAARAARGFPMTDYEVDGIEAAYLINRSTGADRFTCHPFGRAGERCA